MIKKDKEKLKEQNHQPATTADEKTQKASQPTDNNTENDEAVHQDETTPEQSTQNGNEETAENNNTADTKADIDPKEIMIRELEEKNKELNEKYLRLFSEFDNFRKRTIKERIELTKTASAELTEAILPILDDLERAYKSATENPDIESLTEGLNLIQTKLRTTLKHKGLEEISTIGEVFDTDYHEAITHIPAENESQKGKVVDEVQKGYTLNGKVIRYAKVVVAN
ncbi:MAG: nucleotide exchange factor GrpE [Bacteroidota bacterium]